MHKLTCLVILLLLSIFFSSPPESEYSKTIKTKNLSLCDFVGLLVLVVVEVLT